MIEPSPYCFSMAATVFRSSGVASSRASAGDFLAAALSALRPAALSFYFLATGVLEFLDGAAATIRIGS
jgi:hypothetical protein